MLNGLLNAVGQIGIGTGAGAGYVNPNSGAGLSNNGYVLQGTGTGTSWVNQSSATNPFSEMHAHIEFLCWFIEAYYPDARKEFEAVKDIERKANEQHNNT